MGIEIDREEFDDEAYGRFSDLLEEQLQALRSTLSRPGFGEGPGSIGMELEVDLIDVEARPLLANTEVLARTTDPRIVPEIDRYNLEINTRPSPLAGSPFRALRAELESGLAEIARGAAELGGRVVAIGILPTLEPHHLTSDAMTDRRRYRALSAGVRRARPTPLRVQIDEGDGLALDVDGIALEGANTSFQVHLRVAPGAFARAYNAAQLAIAPVLAAGGNSPTFLGRSLWDETRIALFRQSVDDRPDGELDGWRPARVSFGHGWVRQGAAELFEESVALHAPLLPAFAAVTDEPSATPALEELRLHHGTVWRWNRAVYDPTGDGHLRIELRALPAGPTVVDMLASAAFAVGLTLGLEACADALVTRMTFGQARRNFYEAARRGLDAELLWPGPSRSVRLVDAGALVHDLLPIARSGLVDAGVDAREADELLDVIRERVDARVTGARWQRCALQALGNGPGACASMLERYVELAASGDPVHRWPSLAPTSRSAR